MSFEEIKEIEELLRKRKKLREETREEEREEPEKEESQEEKEKTMRKEKKKIVYYSYDSRGELWIYEYSLDKKSFTIYRGSREELRQYERKGYIVKPMYLYRYKVVADGEVLVEKRDQHDGETERYYVLSSKYKIERLKKKYGNNWSPWFDREIL